MKNNTLFKISDEVAKKLKDLFDTPDFKKEMQVLKDGTGDDTGTFRMVISTDNVDRHGEVVSQDGWQLENYMKNAVVLWGHDSYSIPVGITDKLSIEINGSNKSLIAEGRFASHEFAQTLRKLYDAKMLKASSVGFIPLEYEGNTITKAELLEWSFVSIPANPFALDAAKTFGLDIPMLMAKGFLKEMKEGEDTVTPDEDDAEKKDDEEVETGADAATGGEPTAEELAAQEAAEAGETADDAVVDETAQTLTVSLADGSQKTFKISDKFVGSHKAGRVLSKANKEKIINAKLALEEVIALSEETTEEAIEVSADKSNDVQEAEDFLKLRKGVQGVFADLQDILTEAKSAAQKKGITVR